MSVEQGFEGEPSGESGRAGNNHVFEQRFERQPVD